MLVATTSTSSNLLDKLSAWAYVRRRPLWAFGQIGVFFLAFALLYFGTGAHPVWAYTFEKAQTAVDTAFPIAQTVVDLAFNGGRALFGLYLLVSIFKVLHSIRQEEDWQATAQTPAMVFIGVQLADLATTLIYP